MEGLRFAGVARHFAGRPVLVDVTFTVDAGAIVGVIGDNGAGKTTALRLAAGLLRPTAGEIRLGTVEPAHARTRIGGLIERPGHYDELTVRENLTFFYAFYGPGARPSTGPVADALRTFGLSAVAGERVGRLSTGYRQRLALARAFHPAARLVLLDEPFESLDPGMRYAVKDRLRRCRTEGRCVLVSSHTLHDLAELCDRVLLLADGRIRAFESFTAMQRESGLPAGASLDEVYAAYRRARS